MATFLLIPGAGGAAWYWHRVAPLLKEAGHEAIAVDLPGDDPEKGIDAYANIVVEAAGSRVGLILVAQSLGGFTAAAASSRLPKGRIDQLVFVNAMIPIPGETAGDWWGATGSEEARRAAAIRGGYSPEFDVQTYFLHDVPNDVAAAGAAHRRDEAKIAFTEPARFQRWPGVSVHVLVGKDDRFFPRDFQVRVARERLGANVDITEIEGGHLLTLSRPRELADRLLTFAAAGERHG
jgi:pimeloyl-ACP methyl ester carboxylesterase